MSRLEVIDPDGTTIAVKDVEIVHVEHLLHRAVHILIVDSLGRLYLRQRPQSKKLYPGIWTSAVGAHVLEGYQPAEVAKESLRTFLHLTGEIIPLGERKVEDEVENEMVTFFLVRGETVPQPNPEEAMNAGFFTHEEIDRLMQQGKTTPYVSVGLLLYKSYEETHTR